MARPKKKKDGVDPQGWKAEGEQTDHRVTNQGNGSVMAIVPKAEPEPIVLPPAEEALAVLEKLAYQNQRVETARKRYEESAATTKARKGTWETEAEALSKMLSEATHAKPLPLFDVAQSEADLARMESAVQAMGQEGTTEAAPEAQGVSGDEPPIILSAAGQSVPAASEAF